MIVSRGCILYVLLLYFVGVAIGSAIKERTSKRVNLPFLGLGYNCRQCPQHFCDDDEAIIYGYCCGCARLFDVLPVKCSSRITCPPNGHTLCEDYEYMMHCCC